MPVSPSWSFSGLKLHHKSGEASYALALVHWRRWWYHKGAITHTPRSLQKVSWWRVCSAMGFSAAWLYKDIQATLWLYHRFSLVRWQKTTSGNQVRNTDLILRLIYIYIPRVYSGDGTLSVMDIRSRKPDLVAQSEDQDDELLSIVAIKGFVSFLSFNLTLKR